MAVRNDTIDTAVPGNGSRTGSGADSVRPPAGRGRRTGLLACGLALAGLGGLVALTAVVDPETARAITREGGPVESLSAMGYFVCIFLLLFLGRNFRHHWPAMYVLLLFGARELDFNDRFTTKSMTKIRFYDSPDVPIIEKIIVIAVVMFFLFSIFLVVKRHGKNLIRGLRHMRPHALGIVLGVLLLFFSKSFDGLTRKHPDIANAIENAMGDTTGEFPEYMEEIGELGIPIMFLIAIVTRFRTSQGADSKNEDRKRSRKSQSAGPRKRRGELVVSPGPE